MLSEAGINTYRAAGGYQLVLQNKNCRTDSTTWIADDVTLDVCAKKVKENTTEDCQTGVFDYKDERCSCCTIGTTVIDNNVGSDIYRITRSSNSLPPMVREGFKCSNSVKLSSAATEVDSCAALVRNASGEECDSNGYFMTDAAN